MKILIIQTAFIGDVILATPLIEKLHRYDAETVIDFMVKKGNESVLHNHPYIRRLLVFDKADKTRSLFNIIKEVRSQSYDYIINLHRFSSSGLITALSGAKVKIGFDKNPFSYIYNISIPHIIGKGRGVAQHEIVRNLQLIESFTNNKIFKPVLYPSAHDFVKMTKHEKYICIAPASVWYTKQFPAERWVELIQQYDANHTIYLIGSKSDYALCELIAQQSASGKVKILAGELTLLESAALMKNAVMNYVNDSAPLHMASAMNAPVTAIYCSTIPEFGFGPLSDESFIWETELKLSCRPCGLHGRTSCPLGHFKCSEIEVRKA